MEQEIRQPIVTVAGHVDHGKTSILDKIRSTSIQEKEEGGITQKISFTEMPAETIQKRAGVVLEKFKIPLKLPGFLFIDTPGHAAFTNLRKRGGSLADIAILVIDVNEGIKPQTSEVLKILKANKTPFIIALNKLDNISGWQTPESKYFFESISKQAINVKQNFEEKFYTLIGSLNSYGIEADMYTNIQDFTKKVAIVPCSAQTGEGISEILAMIAALSQKFLQDRIVVKQDAKGVVLEVKKEKSINLLESILYDGNLSTEDKIAIASLDKENPAILTKIRNIQKALPLNKGFETTNQVKAAAGLKLQITEKQDILPGMPFHVVKSDEHLEEIKKEFREQISEEIQTDENGIVVKAESLGSLEALLVLLRQKNISVIRAGIGPITKKDIYVANSLPEEDRAILGFNSNLAEDVDIEETKNVKIISNPVVYKIIEDFEVWKQERIKQIERKKLEQLPSVCEINILPFVFRNSNPAVFGIKILKGKLKQESKIIDRDNNKVGRVKSLQHEKNNIQEATEGQEVAVSIPGVNFDRQLEQGQNLYTDLSETQFRKFKEHKELLTQAEKQVLMKIAEIKRKSSPTWGV